MRLAISSILTRFSSKAASNGTLDLSANRPTAVAEIVQGTTSPVRVSRIMKTKPSSVWWTPLPCLSGMFPLHGNRVRGDTTETVCTGRIAHQCRSSRVHSIRAAHEGRDGNSDHGRFGAVGNLEYLSSQTGAAG